MGVEVRVEGLAKSFGGRPVWSGVSLTLPAGVISVLLGPSGTGKSVFLMTLVGLLRPDRGAGLARALVLEPRIVLFDEPDSGLDPVRTTYLNQLIIDLTQRTDATFLIVTHDINTARTVPDSICPLYHGRPAMFGPRELLFSTPRRRRRSSRSPNPGRRWCSPRCPPPGWSVPTLELSRVGTERKASRATAI